MPKIVWTYAISALFMFFFSSFFNGGTDISVHDTYYVIDSNLILVIIAVLFFGFSVTTGILYAFSKPLSSWLNWIHFALSIVSIFAFAVIHYWTLNIQTKQYSSLWDVEEYNPAAMSINDWVTVIAITFALSQLLFVTNVVRALVLKNN